MKRHGPLVLAWLATMAMFVLAILFSPAYTVLAQLIGMILAAVSYVRSERDGELVYPRIHRAVVGLLLLAVATVVVAAGSTVAFEGRSRAFGFAALATTNLVALVMTWRVLTRPTPRATARIGVLAVIVELAAIIFDAISNTRYHFDGPAAGIALIAAFAATWVGAFVCLAALLCFEPRSSVFAPPEARVIDQ